MTINSVVESPTKAIQKSLHILPSESCEDFCLDVGLSVAIRVFAIPNIRSRCNKNSTVITDNTGRPREMVSKERALFVCTVVVCILEHSYISQKLFVLLGVIAHFDNEHTPVFVKGHSNWVSHERFARRKFQPISRFDLDRSHRLVWFHRWRARQFIRKAPFSRCLCS